jgi:hypothetical protein
LPGSIPEPTHSSPIRDESGNDKWNSPGTA